MAITRYLTDYSALPSLYGLFPKEGISFLLATVITGLSSHNFKMERLTLFKYVIPFFIGLIVFAVVKIIYDGLAIAR